MKRLYFGHPTNTYSTRLEKRLTWLIWATFRRWQLENPSNALHEHGYQLWKAAHNGNGMGYYYEMVLPTCQGGIFLPFRDGAWGAGVYGEAKWFLDNTRPIWLITHEGVISPLAMLSTQRVLTVEETKARIRTPSGDVAPY